MGDLLAAFFTPCEGLPVRQLDSAVAGIGSTCLVVSAADTVVPRDLTLATLAASLVVESTVARHGSFDGLGRCLDQVAGDGRPTR
jgi:hypothetical protein